MKDKSPSFFVAFLLSFFTGSGTVLATQGDGTPLQFNRVTPEVQVVRLVDPAIVFVQTNKQVPVAYYNLFEGYYKRKESYPFSQGSGVVIDPEGYILTNEHVIRGADEIKVSFNPQYGKETYIASLVNADADNDLALLKIEGDQPFASVALGRSNDLMIGEKAIAIGNPYGEQNTVTAGIISAIGRDVTIEGRAVQDLIQTDASINPGNSGGPLLNIQGELIGINTAIHPLAEGIGFAIPVNRVVEVLNTRLFNPQFSEKLWLGIEFQNSNQAAVGAVDPLSPADLLGIQKGDRISSVDRTPIQTPADLWKFIWNKNPGDAVQLVIQRNQNSKELSLRLGSSEDRYIVRRLGALVTESPDQNGVFLQKILPEGPADQIHMKEGDLLNRMLISFQSFLEVQKRWVEISNKEILIRLLKEFEPGTALEIKVERNGEVFKGKITLRD